MNPSGNGDPIPDRAGINHIWRKDIKPKKSALLNPLKAEDVHKNMLNLIRATPFDFSKYELDQEEEEDEDVKNVKEEVKGEEGIRAFYSSDSQSGSGAGPGNWGDISGVPASKQES